MRIVSSATVWSDAIGERISITYSEIDETTGQVIADNKRIDRLLVSSDDVQVASDLKGIAQRIVNSIE